MQVGRIAGAAAGTALAVASLAGCHSRGSTAPDQTRALAACRHIAGLHAQVASHRLTRAQAGPQVRAIHDQLAGAVQGSLPQEPNVATVLHVSGRFASDAASDHASRASKDMADLLKVCKQVKASVSG